MNNQGEHPEHRRFMNWVKRRSHVSKYLFALEIIPGYFFMFPTRKYLGMLIAFQFDKNNFTDDQVRFFETAKGVGYHCIISWSWEDAARDVENYLR